MTTPAALRELADRLAAVVGHCYPETVDMEIADIATQLRTAASEGGPSEVVAYQWLRNGKPTGGWFDGVPTERQLQAQKQCTGVAEWTVKYAYSHPPEVARDAGRLDFFDAHKMLFITGVNFIHVLGLKPKFSNIREAIDAAAAHTENSNEDKT